MSAGVVVASDELLVGVAATEHEVPDGLAFHLSVKLDEGTSHGRDRSRVAEIVHLGHGAAHVTDRRP